MLARTLSSHFIEASLDHSTSGLGASQLSVRTVPPMLTSVCVFTDVDVDVSPFTEPESEIYVDDEIAFSVS